ncbi:unnamed protein product [Adineta ricciae]|uniref:Uncharacterized protein n=1 Tax=Adineta ricciae TaxID=249248 RepID=A0A815RNW8_ADIRI|nr:unnamed protein product [Adineta ricciae]CAF1629375.1 unnamed protein product [Adineta ricciae]
MASYEMSDVQRNHVVVEQPPSINNVCCGFGSKYYVILTDGRIIQREEQRRCGCTCGRVDSMFFLSDISGITDKAECRCPSLNCASLLCILFCCPCLVLCALCDCSNCRRGVPITLRALTGSEVFIFDRRLVYNALADIPNAARPHKITSQPSQASMSVHGAPYPAVQYPAFRPNVPDYNAAF